MLPSPTPALANTDATDLPPSSEPHPALAARSGAFCAFRTGELVEVFTDSVRALARVREVSDAGRLHIAFEMGEYLPWVDAAVLIRQAAPVAPVARAFAARILHAGTSTALLQVLGVAEELPPGRQPFDTVPLLEE